jgi:hypothetical protein
MALPSRDREFSSLRYLIGSSLDQGIRIRRATRRDARLSEAEKCPTTAKDLLVGTRQRTTFPNVCRQQTSSMPEQHGR